MDRASNSVLRLPEIEMVNRRRNEAVNALSLYFYYRQLQGARLSGPLV